MDDDELEQMVRSGLVRRADETAVDVGLVAVARSDARRRRGLRAVVVGATAAGVLAASVVAGVVLSTGQSGPTAVDASAREDPSVTAPEASAWRTETWGDLQVDVPADWGYGGAPDADGVACFAGVSLDADGAPVRARSMPPGYVGRPILLTDVCLSIDAGAPVQGPYVWLGAQIEPGEVDLGDGYVQQTVSVVGSTVTVASDDADLRRRIIESVRESERCRSELDRSGPIQHDRSENADAEPVTLRVCAYRLVAEGSTVGDWELTYAADLDTTALEAYVGAVAVGDPPRDQCPAIDYQLGEAVVLEILDGDGGVLRQDAVNPFYSCAGIAVDADRVWPLETTALTPDMARPWVVGGVGAVIHGDPDLGFIGPQG